ncbi:MAG TPA: RNA methyltransferase [Firmicutes bacterium]|jgi:TrmH family RNA methyltransferase|nr:RNA methyltransferase [Bacillota bacterium]
MDGRTAPLRLLKEYRKLALVKYRSRKRKMVLEGTLLLREALLAGIELESLIYTPEFAAKPEAARILSGANCRDKIFRVNSTTFSAIAQTDTPQGVAAIALIPDNRDIFKFNKNFYLVLDRIQDPGNLGTIIRTAAAAGVDGVILLQGTANPYSHKALRSSMGGVFYIPIFFEADQPDWYALMKKKEMHLIAAHPQGELPYYHVNFRRPCTVIIGNESQGVANMLLEKVDTRAFIPLGRKFNTLNAAVAAAAFILEHQRQNSFH